MNTPSFTPVLNRILALAQDEASRQGDAYVALNHVLVAMAQEGSNPGALLFTDLGISIDKLRRLDFTPDPALWARRANP